MEDQLRKIILPYLFQLPPDRVVDIVKEQSEIVKGNERGRVLLDKNQTSKLMHFFAPHSSPFVYRGHEHEGLDDYYQQQKVISSEILTVCPNSSAQFIGDLMHSFLKVQSSSPCKLSDICQIIQKNICKGNSIRVVTFEQNDVQCFNSV